MDLDFINFINDWDIQIYMVNFYNYFFCLFKINI